MSIRWREHPKGSGKGSWYCQIENKEVYGNKRGPAKSGFAKKSAAKEWEEQTIAEAKERKGMADKRGATIASGGSPASRARVIRSSAMLNASTMTVERPGFSGEPNSRRLNSCSALPRRVSGPGIVLTNISSV